MKIGVQLYSLRGQIAGAGLEPVLKMVSEAGFDCVEFAGFYGHSPEEIKQLLDKYGLEGISAHGTPDELPSIIPYIPVVGIRSVYVSYVPYERLVEDLPGVITQIKGIAPELAKAGVRFGYHNHAHEFSNGGDLVWDIMQEIDGFTSELDTFWVTAAGLDPVDVMKKYGKRLSALHIKEMGNGENGASDVCPVVGEGIIDFPRVFDTANEMGIDLAILEAETMACEPAEYLKRSCENMKRMAHHA